MADIENSSDEDMDELLDLVVLASVKTTQAAALVSEGAIHCRRVSVRAGIFFNNY
jgi:hypothetical protein